MVLRLGRMRWRAPNGVSPRPGTGFSVRRVTGRRVFGLYQAMMQLIEMAPDRAPAITLWRVRRLAHVEAGRSRLVVGHEDLAALLPRT